MSVLPIFAKHLNEAFMELAIFTTEGLTGRIELGTLF